MRGGIAVPVTIPKRLEKKLSEDSSYKGYIHTLLTNIKPLITEKADFFPEYTLHGWSHIQAVLIHADKVIPDETMEVLSGRDVALLSAAVILHDIGMFLNRAGVRKLLTGSRRTIKTTKLDKWDWAEEWDRYIQEIRRYPEEKLLYHFGISRTIDAPDLEKGEFSDLDLLIVGDFLRRHHHRIAHEIAMDTMPGDTDVDVLQVGMDALGNKAFGPKDRKCVGILARSHGMPIRETHEYINRELGRQHVEKMVYLMAVLRLADALDADEQRAPDTRWKLDGIRIPVSMKEWIWNQRISRTDLDWDSSADFKYVEAEPESTTEFVQLEKWLKWIQSELDLSWAVLSECCDTQKYRLSIHRIESNILEEERRESYGEKFITKDARLNANPELLKLLVAPLYDNDPSCGVRELLQNAVDACNERAHLEGSGYRGEVQIRLDTKAKTLTVIDNGIGMDENVLLNYYLSAGASYRTSEEWFEKFATGRDSNIVRTGRFGVGVLATFLLGNRVEVTTRHMEDDWGYTFEFGLEPKALDIKRPEAAPEIGTTIVVHLKEDALEKLNEDYRKEKNWLNWYRFAEPSVRYWVDDEEYISGKPFIPQDDREMPGWFELPGTEFEMVRWGYPGEGLYCNGIRIPDGYGINGFYDTDIEDFIFGLSQDKPMIPFPCLSLIDKSGKLPIDLSRKRLQNKKIVQLIETELDRYALSNVLAADWSSEDAATEQLHSGVWNYDCLDIERKIVCSRKGYTILRQCFFNQNSRFPLLIFYVVDKVDKQELIRMLRRVEPQYPFILLPFNEKWLFDSIGGTIANTFFFDKIPSCLSTAASATWIDKGFEQRISESIESQKSFYSINRTNKAKVMEGNKSYCLITTEAEAFLPPPILEDQWDQHICPAISMRMVNPYYSKPWGNPKDEGLRRLIQRFLSIADPWIPYDMEERRKKFPKAFEELKYYIDRILADRDKVRGAQNE